MMTSSTIRPFSSRTISWRARVCTTSTFSERGARKCWSATRVIRASEELSCATIRASRSALAPGTSRSISLWISSGITFFSRNASPRKIIVVTETIEQASSGHMNKPPLVKKPMTVWMSSNMSARLS